MWERREGGWEGTVAIGKYEHEHQQQVLLGSAGIATRRERRVSRAARAIVSGEGCAGKDGIAQG